MSNKLLEDGVIEVHGKVTDTFRMLANEPSVGLFYVQQHVQRAVPNVINLKRHLHAGSTEAKYALEDVQAATSAVRSIKETGPDVISRMLKTLENTMTKLHALKTTPDRGFNGFSSAFQQSAKPVQKLVQRDEAVKTPTTLPSTTVDGATSSDMMSDYTDQELKTKGAIAGTSLETKNLTEFQNVPAVAAKRLYQGPGFMVDRAREGGAFVRSMVDTAFVKSGSKDRRESSDVVKSTHPSMPDTGSGQRMTATQFMRDMLDGARKAGYMKGKAVQNPADRHASAQDVLSKDRGPPGELAAGDMQVLPESECQPESLSHPGQEMSSDVDTGQQNPSNYVYGMLENVVQRANVSRIDVRPQDTSSQVLSLDKISETKDCKTAVDDGKSLDSASLKFQESSGSGRDMRPSQYMRAVFESAILTAGNVVQTAGSAVQSAGETAGNVGRERSNFFKLNKAEAKGSEASGGNPAAGTWTSQTFGKLHKFGSSREVIVDGVRKEGATPGANKEELVDDKSVSNVGDSMSSGPGGDIANEEQPSDAHDSFFSKEEPQLLTPSTTSTGLEQNNDGRNDVDKDLAKRLETWLADE